MKKFRDTIGLTFLLGALIGAIEGFSLLVFGHYGFREPGWGLLDMQFQYGLLALAFLPFAWLIPKLLRLPYKTATDVSSWAFLGFSWIIANWWIHGEFIRGKSIFSPLSLSLVLISVALVFVLHFAIRKIASQSAKSLFGALLAALILAPILAQSNHKSQSPPTSVQASNADKPDVTVVVIDTLRADHLGTYGYQRADGEQTSPFIDSLAETGLVFENTWSQASWTRPSMASLHSGLFCSGHAVNESNNILPDDVITMAEMAYQSGYRTGGFSANGQVSITFGFDQGFEQLWTIGVDRTLQSYSRWGELQHFIVNKVMRGNLWDGKDDAALVNAETFEWLDSIADDTRPKFTYVHYIDPHTPYMPPEGKWPFAGEPEDLVPLKEFVGVGRITPEFPFGVFPDPGKDLVDRVIRNYDAEIRYVDGEFGKLVDKLREQGLLDANDWLILTADHGEEFYERGRWGHGHSLFEDQVHVPLIVWGPGVDGGKRQAQEVNLLDVHATLAEIFDYKTERQFPSISLLPLGDGELHEDEENTRFLYSERLQGANHLFAVRKDFQKLIMRPDEFLTDETTGERLDFYMQFDLRENPGEYPGFDFRDLLDGNNELQRQLQIFQVGEDSDLRALMEYVQINRRFIGAVQGASADLSPETIQLLIELGYMDKDHNFILGNH